MAEFWRSGQGIEGLLTDPEVALLRLLGTELLELLDERAPAAPPTPPGTAAEDAGRAAEDAGTMSPEALEALVGDSDGPVEPPVDPVLARLLPDGYRNDDAAAAELRRLTEPELRAGKQASLRALLASLDRFGGRLLLDEDLAAAWLGAINDIRLALGTRLDVTEDYEAELLRPDPRSERAEALRVYYYCGLLQDRLLEVITDG